MTLLIIEEIKTIIIQFKGSIPYMIYNLPHQYPVLVTIFYCLRSTCNNILLEWTVINYEFYRNYLTYLMYTNDLLIMQNYFAIPKPINKDYLPLNTLHQAFPYTKYNFNRYSMTQWRVQYDLTQIIPNHILTIYYFLKYNVIMSYLNIFSEYDSWTKGLTKPYYDIYYQLGRRYRRIMTSKYGDREIDLITMIYLGISVMGYYNWSHQYYLELTDDYCSTNDADELVEDNIDFELEFMDSEDNEVTEILNDYGGDQHFHASTDWLPEYTMNLDFYTPLTESFNKEYIETESEFNLRFNSLINQENQKKIYESLYKSK